MPLITVEDARCADAGAAAVQEALRTATVDALEGDERKRCLTASFARAYFDEGVRLVDEGLDTFWRDSFGVPFGFTSEDAAVMRERLEREEFSE